MRIAFFTTGTRGDIQPFVAIGAELVARGHSVVMTAPEDLLSFVAAGDVEGVPLPFSAQQVLNSELGQRFLADGDMFAFARAIRDLDALHRPALVEMFLRAAEGVDLVVAHPLMASPAWAVAQARKAPFAIAFMGPTAPTRAFPTPLLNLGSLGPLNRLTHWLPFAFSSRGSRPTAAAVAERLGVPTPPANVFARAERDKAPTLHLYSGTLQPRPDDWAAHHVVTGMVKLSAATRARLGERAPPDGLEAWLSAGAAPVFFGFGSMPVQDPERMLQLIDTVCTALEVRALVGAGWTAITHRPSSDRVFVASAFDHDAVLPRCAAAVHHGGMGTTHSVVQSGLPSVVCHFLVDQPYWGRRLQAHGIGARIPFHQLTAEKLIAALRPLLNPEVKARAEALGVQLRAEDGVANAVAALVSH